MAQVDSRPADAPRADYDVVVIGAGIGGLAAGALLADAGARVLLVERQAVLGGYCHSWYRKVKVNGDIHKFRFDAGAVEFSGAHDGGTLSVLFDRLRVRERIEWLRCDHTYRIGQTVIRVPPDWRDYVAQLGAAFPHEVSGIAAFFDAMRQVAESRQWLAAANGGIARQARTDEERARFQREHAFAAKWVDRPVVELLAAHVTQAAARTALLRLSHFLTADMHTLTVGNASNLYRFYFVGGYYPRGGTGLVANTLADAIRERGGHVMSRTEVRRIRLEGGCVRGVVLDDGREIDADIVVSNSDFRRTFGELLPADALTPDLRASVEGMRPTASGFTVYLAMDFVPTGVRSYTVDGSYAFHIPSLLDPTAAAPGCSVFEVRTIFDKTDNWFCGQEERSLNAWRKSPEYALRKRRFGDWLLTRAEGLVPNLRKHILYRTDASPLTYARYSHANHGALYGWTGRPGAFDSGCTPIDGLYLVGSSALGAGVEGAVISAANAADAILPGLLSCGTRFPAAGAPAANIDGFPDLRGTVPAFSS
ncbi:phytoene dehydrogenase-like protein [Paraburkholderia terricola]|uniref:phytoene desaturase family protein n=1 Tax=Paraburkholderia terricola TaxID=169427 RepID=UPI0028679A5F|nr:NAD(P)/FAD-dependent oxidoreductase [Paraburkholderia terricola]MDR6450047.1 phytoene dehydrogenase-like protein [Paraburkholderia terricola]